MDSINGQIGEEGNAPLLVIDDGSEETAPALVVIETPETVEPVPATPPAPARKKQKEEIVAEEQDMPAAAVSAPLPQPADAAPLVEPAPATAPKAKRNIRPLVPLVAVSLAVFASGLSVVGLLVASRTVAETKLVLEQVREHQNKARHLDRLIDEIDALRDREQLALVRLEQINAGKPATGAEVRGAIANLQMAMAKYQPGGSNGTMTLLRDGQSELAERVSTMYRRVEQINDKMDKMTAGKPRAAEAR